MFLLGDPVFYVRYGRKRRTRVSLYSHDVYDAPTAQRGYCNVDPPECPEGIEEPAPAKAVLSVQHGRRDADERERTHGEGAEVETLHRMPYHGVPHTGKSPVARHGRGAEEHEEYQVEEEKCRAEPTHRMAPPPIWKHAEQQRDDAGACIKKKISTSDRLSPQVFLSKLQVKGAGQHSDNPQVTSNKRGRTGELRERTHVDRKPCWREVSVQNMESKNETSYSDSGCTPYRMLSATPFFFMRMVMGARDLSDKQGGSSG